MADITRRSVLSSAAAAGLAGLVPASVLGAARAKRFRLIHMTDFHVQPELNAAKGMEQALVHAMAQKPDLIITGGDLIMDGVLANRTRTRTQWTLFQSLIRHTVDVPIYHTLGNHDVWGWNKGKSETTGEEALWGKQWFLENFCYSRTYQAFSMGGWKFVILDNVSQRGEGYRGNLDPDQLDWLKSELASTSRSTPVMLVSHIPIYSPCTMLGAFDEKAEEWRVSGSLQTMNAAKIKALLDEHPNVKLCLSGHIHLVDRFDYHGVSYLCNGAVCGAWWTGKNSHFDPGYAVLDLGSDGSWSREYVSWGWKPA